MHMIPLKSQLLKLKNTWPLWLALLGYIAVTLPAFFQSQHLFHNLEPYPDGLLYALSGRNWALGRGLHLTFSFGSVPLWVPPLYPLVLGIGYYLSSAVNTFYLVNCFLGSMTLYFLFLVVRHFTPKPGYQLLILGLYLSHSLLWWLPSVPMSENLSLLIFTGLIWSLFQPLTKKNTLLTITFLISLLLTRYSTIGLVAFSGLVLLVKMKQYLSLKKVIVMCLFLLSLGELVLRSMGTSSMLLLQGTFSQIWQGSEFYNFCFIWPNTLIYLKSLLWQQGPFLWLTNSLSSFAVVGLFMAGLVKQVRQQQWLDFTILTGLFLSVFPLQLVFYTADTRYILYVLPIMLAGIASLVGNSQQTFRWSAILVLAILLNLFLGQNLAKQVIANNWLGRSQAWQQQAVFQFNQTLPENAQIITTLPPFLVDAYQDKFYRILPLSSSQEFLSKKQYIWGYDINYADLIQNYTDWLNQGETLYISNAYITHQQKVIDDFERYKQVFELELIATGCQNACNIYQLHLQPAQ